MKTTAILMGLFIFSFIAGFVWSYILVYKNGFIDRQISDKRLSVSKFIKRVRFAIFNFFLMSLVTCISIFAIGDSFFSYDIDNIAIVAIGFIIMVVVDDLWFYIIHRIMHEIPFLYKKIHIVHHKAMPPIPMDYLYAHPIEAMGASMGLAWGMIALILLFGKVSILVFGLYTFYRTMHELAVHSGMTVIPEKYLGIIGSSKHHYLHHKHLKGNYASGLTYLDKLFNTYIAKD